MAEKKASDHEAETWAILGGLLVWIFFGSFFFGILAGIGIYYFVQNHRKKDEED